MKALDESIWYTMITGIIGDKFHFIEKQKKISYMKERKENETERRYQVTIVTENPTRIYQVKWMELNDVSSYKLYDSIDFLKNLTGSFG